ANVDHSRHRLVSRHWWRCADPDCLKRRACNTNADSRYQRTDNQIRACIRKILQKCRPYASHFLSILLSVRGIGACTDRCKEATEPTGRAVARCRVAFQAHAGTRWQTYLEPCAAVIVDERDIGQC